MANGLRGTIVFSTVQRPAYGFDVFSVKVPSDLTNFKPSKSDEQRLTDGISINFNAQFLPQSNDSIVYVSERNGWPSIHLSKPESPEPQHLSSLHPESIFHDRPIIKNNRLYFISAHEKPDQILRSWNALYAADLDHQSVTRLSPPGVVDFSPAVSLSGKFIAVASFGLRPWGGEFFELNTEIVVFKSDDPDKRFVVCERGGWPSWSRDSTIFFHRQADDGWWSIFRVDFSDFSDFPVTPVRVTPPGFHCFTPAAFHDGQKLAVATRRRNSKHRHIEIFDLETKAFYPITELLNPSFHHYNPFVSEDSLFVGYHRFRGESAAGEVTIRNLEPIKSRISSLRMFRLNGSFPAFSPSGDLIAYNPDFNESNRGLKIVKSDGSKRWTLIKDRIAFYTAWSSTEENAIYTTVGQFFAPPNATVQIARVTFDPSDLKPDRNDIPFDVKILTREDTGNNAFASCSPDGKSIVFRSGRSGHKNLYITDAVDGEFNGDIRRITEGPWTDTMPSWSPKGDLIAFSSNRHNPKDPIGFSIYVIKPDGSGLRRVHVAGPEGSRETDRERINHVCFSDDGEWLLFTANLGGVTADPSSVPHNFQPYGDLFVCRLDGSELTRLTWNGYENGTPAWRQHDESHVTLMRSLRVEEGEAGDNVSGQFDDPLWIRFDSSDENQPCL